MRVITMRRDVRLRQVMNVLDFIATVYSYLGMDFALKLSTRPETALGDAAVWDKVCLIA